VRIYIILSPQTGEVKEEKQLHEKQINDLKMSPDGTHFITASSDKTAKLVDTQVHDFQTRMHIPIPCLSASAWLRLRYEDC